MAVWRALSRFYEENNVAKIKRESRPGRREWSYQYALDEFETVYTLVALALKEADAALVDELDEMVKARKEHKMLDRELNGILKEEGDNLVVYFHVRGGSGEKQYKRRVLRSFFDLEQYLDAHGDFSRWIEKDHEDCTPEMFQVEDGIAAFQGKQLFQGMQAKHLRTDFEPDGMYDAFLSAIRDIAPVCELVLSPPWNGLADILTEEEHTENKDDVERYIGACRETARFYGIPVR